MIVCFLFSPCHGEEKDSKKQANKYFSTTSLSLVLTKGNNENSQKRVTINNVPNSTAMIEKTMSASFISTLMTNKLIYNVSPSAQVVLQEIIFINLEDLKDYRTNSFASLSASINRHFGLNTSLQVIYERKPVPGYKHTDFYLLSSFVIKI